ncbi:MAG: nitrate ABC transporter permease [Beijerinckiaceae bacterium]|nr:nitrate ABC transporter permease [Beijerinckiaceae bacterium]
MPAASFEPQSTSAPENAAQPAAALPLPVADAPAPSKLAERVRSVAATVLPPTITLVAILMLWQLAYGGPTSGVPSPLRVWSEASEFILKPFFWNGDQDFGLGWAALTSLKRVAVGYSMAAVLGILVGSIVGQSVWASRGLDPIFQVLRTVPPLAWLPLSLAALRDSDTSAIFVIFITSIWPILINTAVGVRNIPQDYRNVAQVLRLNSFEFFWKITMPAAAPYIFTGLRIGIGLSWLSIVAAEIVAGGSGIGIFMWNAYNSSHLSEIVVAIAYIGLIGFALDRMIGFVGDIVSRGAAAN